MISSAPTPASGPSTSAPPVSNLRRWLWPPVVPAGLVGGTLHLLLALPIGIVAFVVTVVLGVLGAGLLPLYPLGVLVLAAWVQVVDGLAALDRGRLRHLVGYAVLPTADRLQDGSAHARLWRRVRRRATWRAVAHHLLALPVGIVSFVTTVMVWLFPPALIVSPLAALLITGGQIPLVQLLPLLAAPVVGIALLPAIPHTVQALTDLSAAVTGAFLGPSERDRLGQRVEQLSTSRSDLVDLAEQERRRIERDLHDGAGQQLVSLAMTLGMAKEKLDADPRSARELIDEAHAEAKRAIVELRDIVRGISPAILTDRGLGAALSAVAARSAVPVDVTVEVADRPSPPIEGIAYFVVCEGIGNAVRHARASRIRVKVVRDGDLLRLEVADDGRGGADPTRGTGLRGLAGRIAAVDGDLAVSSPDGGGTVLRATLPAEVAALEER